MLPDDPTPGGAFWRFSLDFYARPGVSAACLALQDEHGLDVNLVLYACWVGISGCGRLGVEDLAAAERAVAPWRGAVLEKLRAARRAMKHEDVAELYAEAKALELAAEREAQRRIAAMAPPERAGSDDQRIADARANLMRYVGERAAAAAAPIAAALAMPGR